MTNYHLVIDAISQELYSTFQQEQWDEESAKQRSHKILTLVEQFQTRRTQPKWRATD
jgi:hypothetical protein